jgi:TatD DNase family protein
MKIFESHSHLQLPEFSEDLEEVMDRAQKAGVIRLINIGIDYETSKMAIELAAQREGYFATVGFHPHNAKDFTPVKGRELLELTKDPSVVGIGEIGLDYHWDNSPRDIQKEVFQWSLKAAAELGKPVVIHTRDAFTDTLELLREHKDSLSGILIHCFTGTPTEALAFLELGAFLSIPGVVTYKNAQELRSAIKVIPKGRLLIETDCPYLAPVPFRGRRNEPAFLVHHLKALGEILEMPPEEVADLTFQNALRFFSVE